MSSSKKIKKIVELAVKKDVKNFKDKIKETMQCFEEENYGRCVEISLNLLKTNNVQKNPHILAVTLKNLGAAYFKLTEYNNSIKYYLEALKTLETHPKIDKPKREDIEKEMGLAKILKIATEGNLEDALQECNSFIKNNPESIAAIELKGNILYTLQKYEDAILHYYEIIGLKNKDIKLENAYYKIGICYFHLDDLGMSREYLKKARDENPQNGKIYFALGEVEFKQGLFEAAAISLETGEKLLPKEINFLLYLIENYRQLGLNKKIIPKTKKIIKSGEPQIFRFLIEWLKKIEDKQLKNKIFSAVLSLLSKRQELLAPLAESLMSDADDLTALIQEFKKEKELNRKRNIKHIQCINDLLESLAKNLEAKKTIVEKLWTQFIPFFEKEEIEEILDKWQDLTKNVLESKLLEKIIKDHKLPQEWMHFAVKIKETQQDLIKPLKMIDYFLRGLINISKKTTVSLEGDGNGAIKIKENINSVKFSIFPDFPGKLSQEILSALILFYEERLELWDKLPDLIVGGKFNPPALQTLSNWEKKTGEKLPDNSLFLEELNREGNNLKLDLLMQKIEKEYTKKVKPLIPLFENSNSIPLKMRFQEKEIKAKNGELEFIAFKYFSYIRKNTKVKV